MLWEPGPSRCVRGGVGPVGFGPRPGGAARAGRPSRPSRPGAGPVWSRPVHSGGGIAAMGC
ncbi:Uncharacterised protein [Amycolatopsis camponoti]|uniref:Uncharacterized protein n=1 Tax=Amycolatopsis camponoti TaxID=2606593 RepID=A0A6I8LUL5_9PSEU|nr:Uncharacterised protein [Amycolatopsis camponoti]